MTLSHHYFPRFSPMRSAPCFLPLSRPLRQLRGGLGSSSAYAQSGVREEACTIYEVTVHFFGDAMAILYGSESAVHVEADGRKHTVKLTWTDTWLKRRGVWQIVAAQDMPSEVK